MVRRRDEEQVSQQVIQTKYERRPTILTKYQYASGAVVFATSNLKPNGKLDRVFLNTEAVSQALKENSKLTPKVPVEAMQK